MPAWSIILIVIGAFALLAMLVYVTERVARAARRISSGGGDTAPGWIIRCTHCDAWRPATEAGIVRVAAAGTKSTVTRCSACRELCKASIEKGPGPEGRRRIDEQTNREIWPETLAH